MNDPTNVNEEKELKLKENIETSIKEKFWDVYASNTGTLSSICRQLAFAEGGICWFYIQDSSFTPSIKLILTFLILFLLLMLVNTFF